MCCGCRAAERAATVLQTIPGVGAIGLDEHTGDVHFRCEGGAEVAAVAVAAIIDAGLKLAHFGQVEGSLEAAFVRLAREDEAATAAGVAA